MASQGFKGQLQQNAVNSIFIIGHTKILNHAIHVGKMNPNGINNGNLARSKNLKKTGL